MIADDTQDWEDYSQYVKVLQCLGYSTNKAVVGVERVRRLIKQRAKRRNKLAPIIAQRETTRRNTQTRSMLACIINPNDMGLEALPAFHRYLGMLAISYHNDDIAKRLCISRTSLWRFLVRNQYSLKGATR